MTCPLGRRTRSASANAFSHSTVWWSMIQLNTASNEASGNGRASAPASETSTGTVASPRRPVSLRRMAGSGSAATTLAAARKCRRFAPVPAPTSSTAPVSGPTSSDRFGPSTVRSVAATSRS